jgi:hypothetical protein
LAALQLFLLLGWCHIFLDALVEDVKLVFGGVDGTAIVDVVVIATLGLGRAVP